MREEVACSIHTDPTAASAQEPTPEATYWARRQALRPLRLLSSTLMGMVFVLAMGWLSYALDEPTDFDQDLLAVTRPKRPPPWVPSYGMDRDVLNDIDFEVVHAQLLPQWVISLQHDPYTLGQVRESRRFEALKAQVARDRNLTSLLYTLRDHVTSGVTAYAAEITHLLDGWNAYMQDAGLPWYVAYDLLKTARGGRLYTRSYRVSADVSAEVSGMPQHLRVLERVDSTNVGELFFGQTDVDERRALIVSDRIAEFALERLWPLMDPEADRGLEPVDRAFAPALRREAATTLTADTLAALHRGAVTHRALQQRLDEIVTRKACGRGIEVENLPWNGLTLRGRAIVSRAADDNESRNCTRLTREDARLLLDASEALSTDEELRVALGQLGAWLARAVSVHEVRHLADNVSESSAPKCDGCPSGMSARGKAEVSAYVASAAQPGVGYLALYQACGVDLPTMHASGGAVEYVLGVLMPRGCQTPPSPALYSDARLLDWILFKRVEGIKLASDFPAVLPLPAVRTEGSPLGFEELAGGPLQTRHGAHPAFPMRAML